MKHVLQHSQAARWALLLVAGGLAVSSADAAYLVLQGGSRVDGRGVRLNARGDYVIETASGSRTYPAAQVLRAEADKPDGFDRAIAAASAGQDEQAIAALTDIARRNRGLGWDSRAQASIAQIQMSRNNFAGAVAAFEAVGPDGIAQSALQTLYWKALLETEDYAKLGPLLDVAIREDDRALAARAQTLRGDTKLKQRLLESAVIDYLRTVHFFKAVTDVQPEALYKAGVTLEEMRHPKAKDMFDTLIQQYPQSEYAKRARNR